MKEPIDLKELSGFIVENAVSWIQVQRDTFRSTARELSNTEKTELEGFFPVEILDMAMIQDVPVIKNPDFYSMLRERGAPEPLDLSTAIGITYIDTILISKRYVTTSSQCLPLLFHELIHVVQYELLGVRKFMEEYVRGWMENGFSYSSIPLETHAFELQGRYDSDPRTHFPIIDEVLRRVDRS